MAPLLVTVPPTVLLVMVMPVPEGGAPPFAVSTPELATLPVTLAPFSMRMQVPAGEALLTVATVPPFCVTVQPANAEGTPPPNRAASEVDANSNPRRPQATRIRITEFPTRKTLGQPPNPRLL